MCATLSSLIKNRESEHFDKAVDILWALYELAPDLIPFETFGNLLIDILICVSSIKLHLRFVNKKFQTIQAKYDMHYGRSLHYAMFEHWFYS